MNGWEPYSIVKGDFNFNFDQGELENYDYIYERAINSIIILAVSLKDKYQILTPSELSNLWYISLPDAKNVLDSTTAISRRVQDGQMSRCFRTDLHSRRYRRLGGHFSRFYTDTLFFGAKTLRGNNCAQIYVNRAGYTKIYPLVTKSQAHESLSSFIHEVGIPSSLHSDDAKEIVEGRMMEKIRKYEIYSTMNEPYSPWQDLAERIIGIVKSKVRQIMRQTNTPIRLVDYAMSYVCDIRNFTPTGIVGTENRTSHELVNNDTADISEYICFGWYDFVWYWNPVQFQKQNLGRWIGVAHSIGSDHVNYILTKKGTVVARSMVTRVSADEIKVQNIKDQILDYKLNVKTILGDFDEAIFHDNDANMIVNSEQNILLQESPDFLDESEFTRISTNEGDDNNDPIYSESQDWYIGASVFLPHLGEMSEGKIVSRKRTSDGKSLVGRPNTNPILDTRVYNVEFNDGSVEEFTTNMISESIFDQIDEEGYSYNILKGIIGHRKDDDAVELELGMVEVNGIRKRIVTTKGWDINVEWCDGSTSWVPLRVIKNSNPVETAEYAISRGIDQEPAFAWWVSKIMRKRDRIISKLKTNRKVRKNIKFGIKIPLTVEEAKELDKLNNNSFWEDAIKKELEKVRVAFELIDEGEAPIPGSKKINYHFVFDVKHDLVRKARLVAGGHLNKNVPSYLSYSSVILKETVRLCFMVAALNGLEILVGDIGNAYLNAKPRERCYVTITDPFLFGPSCVGRQAQIVRALYGMKSSGAAWRDLFASVLHKEMNFENCMADHDLWFHADVDGEQNEYYTYICIYVDDVLIVSHQPSKYMDQIKGRFLVKPDSIEVPKRYLGMDCKRTDENVWLLGPNHYLQEFIKVSSKLLDEIGIKLMGRGHHPFSNIKYWPELDTSDFCDESQTRVFQQILGMLRWLIELGRVDVLLETTLLASFLMAPRVGHLDQVSKIVLYLKKHQRSTLMMDPAKLDLRWDGNDDDNPERRREIMKTIYRDATDEFPPNAPPAKGKSVQVNIYCDSDHASDRTTRRSHTGIILFVNMAPISWYSPIESSTFGSEYVALRVAIEKAISMRYKLRMMGLKIDGSANIFMDNESVVKSRMNPEATLKRSMSRLLITSRESPLLVE